MSDFGSTGTFACGNPTGDARPGGIVAWPSGYVPSEAYTTDTDTTSGWSIQTDAYPDLIDSNTRIRVVRFNFATHQTDGWWPDLPWEIMPPASALYAIRFFPCREGGTCIWTTGPSQWYEVALTNAVTGLSLTYTVRIVNCNSGASG